MRIVVLTSSVYSETACALAIHLAQSGYVPVGALALRTTHPGTLLRKVGQWGIRGSIAYARTKLSSRRGSQNVAVRNPYLAPLLRQNGQIFRSLRDVAHSHAFPVALCGDQNSPSSIAHLKQWSPDVIIFAGGNILREQLLSVPRLGVLNAHLGLLPEIRGMSSPEWSLLTDVPQGVTIHYIDAGIDTGPILPRFEFADAARCASLDDLRNRLIAFGVEKMVEMVAALDRGAVSLQPQPAPGRGSLNEDTQFFVMHEWLRARAAEHLVHKPRSEGANSRHG
jgi:hypothetical protein